MFFFFPEMHTLHSVRCNHWVWNQGMCEDLPLSLRPAGQSQVHWKHGAWHLQVSSNSGLDFRNIVSILQILDIDYVITADALRLPPTPVYFLHHPQWNSISLRQTCNGQLPQYHNSIVCPQRVGTHPLNLWFQTFVLCQYIDQWHQNKKLIRHFSCCACPKQNFIIMGVKPGNVSYISLPFFVPTWTSYCSLEECELCLAESWRNWNLLWKAREIEFTCKNLKDNN